MTYLKDLQLLRENGFNLSLRCNYSEVGFSEIGFDEKSKKTLIQKRSDRIKSYRGKWVIYETDDKEAKGFVIVGNNKRNLVKEAIEQLDLKNKSDGLIPITETSIPITDLSTLGYKLPIYSGKSLKHTIYDAIIIGQQWSNTIYIVEDKFFQSKNKYNYYTPAEYNSTCGRIIAKLDFDKIEVVDKIYKLMNKVNSKEPISNINKESITSKVKKPNAVFCYNEKEVPIYYNSYNISKHPIEAEDQLVFDQLFESKIFSNIELHRIGKLSFNKLIGCIHKF